MSMINRPTVTTPANRTTHKTGIAMEIAVGPKPSAWATSARAIIAPDRMARKIVTRLRASLYVKEPVASRLQCSVARICSLVAALDSRKAGATSVDIWFASLPPLARLCDP